MIVAVQRGLTSIKKRLELMGYKVVFSDEYEYPVDAYIYAGSPHGSMTALTSFHDFAGSVYSAGAYHGARETSGVIEINASEKSFDEIERSLSARRGAQYF